MVDHLGQITSEEINNQSSGWKKRLRFLSNPSTTFLKKQNKITCMLVVLSFQKKKEFLINALILDIPA